MKILYLSCHSILEYDELKLFEEMGHDYFSIGSYINPTRPHDPKRPPLTHIYHEQLAAVTQTHNQNNLHREQVSWADVVIVMHRPEWIVNNWPLFKELGTRVVWRSIGQSTADVEDLLAKYRAEGLQVLRYSPREVNIPGNIGSDAVIRFYKDPAEFGAWNGDTEELITFCQSMKSREVFCNFEAFSKIAVDFDAHVYGPNNEDAGKLNGGTQEYDDLKAKMRNSRAYFAGNTHPASYVLNFIEAWMTGIPVVAVGPLLGNSPIFQQQTYEVPQLIENGVDGFWSDDLNTLNGYVHELMGSPEMAAEVGRKGRESAIKIFGKDTVKQQWKEFLDGNA